MKNYITVILGLILALSAQAEDLIITSFDSGKLTWSNRVANAEYRVEWKSTLTDQWQTNNPVFSVTSTSNVTSVDVPMYFRVVWLNPPSVRFTSYNAGASSFPDGIDLNSDGKIDLLFSRSFLTTGDGFGEEFLNVKTYNCDICLTPFLASAPINSTNNWVDSKYTLTLASRREIFGPYTGGPWANVTNAYLAVKLKSDTSVNYGWLSLTQIFYTIEGTETESSYFRLNDGASESEENKEILAGQTE